MLVRIAIIYFSIGLVAVVTFLIYAIYDRKKNGVPWNKHTIASRIPMLLTIWPIFSVAILLFAVGWLQQSIGSSRDEDA